MFRFGFPPGDTMRAISWFLGAYVFVNVPAFGLYLALVLLSGGEISPPNQIMQDPSYILAHKLYPILNFAFWALTSWLFFRRSTRPHPTLNQKIHLGLFWLLLALPLDLLVYVLLPTPFAISFNDFYLGQSPWIYLTYLSIILGPACYGAYKRRYTVDGGDDSSRLDQKGAEGRNTK